MGRIRILSDAVANKIAAGEVVERPASVVKELLENSLDAGATELRVEVEAGGRRLIRVVDDGCGMLRDDAMLAFERHATSKLSDIRDLAAISTLGFRGEALPSIASVSRLLLETRSREETTGTAVEIAGGKLLRSDETALAPGTTITVRDLFYNVPARRKFLRSEQTELAHIASLVTHYSLAQPSKTFRLYHQNRELLQATPVGHLRERVFQVFGGETLEELIELQPAETRVPAPGEGDGPAERSFRLRGFVSQPHLNKLNRNSIFLFVNGRLIRDRLLLHALTSAYHNLMPAGCYPFALLFLECDFDEVDVNVHPSKTEVRFRRGPVIHDFVRDTVRNALIGARPVSNLPAAAFSPPQPAAALPYSEFSQRIAEAEPLEPPSVVPQPPGADAGLPEFTIRAQAPPRARLDFGDDVLAVGVAALPPVPRLRVPDTHTGFPGGLATEAPVGLHGLGDLRPLGQIHDSFIVAAGPDGLWIIDQHVAHERVLFESLLKQSAAGKVERQQLLMPLILQLTPAQQIDYARIADDMLAVGLETEPFGNRTIAVKSAPAGVSAGDMEKLTFEILEMAEGELRRLSMDDIRRVMAASVACRAAIKINTPLERGKIEWLLRALSATDCPMSCPHGRPIALRYSTRDILRSFQRI